MSEPANTLGARLRATGCGYNEWRVQDPKDGGYCMAFSRPDSFNPENEAREWLADHKERYPNSPHANFQVVPVRVLSAKDRLMNEAADEIERPREALEAIIVHEESCDRGDAFSATEAREALTPNVELTGAARLYRAASRERSERG